MLSRRAVSCGALTRGAFVLAFEARERGEPV